MVLISWAGALLLSHVAAQDYSNVGKYSSTGCYSSLPSSFTSQGSSALNSALYCFTQCQNAGYNVAALQNENCYCGNSIPAGGASGTCDIPCPVYGTDKCGGSSAYNIYVKNGAAVSTASGDDSSSSSSSTSTSSSSSPSSSPSSSSSTSSSSSSSTSVTDSSSSSSSSTSASTTDSSASTSAPTASSSEAGATRTISGSVIVSTVIASQGSTATSSNASSTATAAPAKSGISGGAIAGIVIGVVAGVAAILALIFLLWRRRREQFYSPNGSPHKFETSFNSGFNQEYPSVVDQRLNPQLLNHRISIASLADARDYSRQILKIANPDDKE